MRWAVGIVVAAVLAVVGFEYFRPETPPPVAGGVVQPATTAGDKAGGAGETPAERTQALADQVADRAQQVAADAARRMQETAGRVADAAQDVAGAGAPLKVDDTDVGKRLTDALNHVTAALGGITDPTSAQAAVPELVEVDARLHDLEPKIERLSDDGKKTLAALVTGMLPEVQSAIDRVQATPGAAEVVKPALDPILAKLDDWSKKPA